MTDCDWKTKGKYMFTLENGERIKKSDIYNNIKCINSYKGKPRFFKTVSFTDETGNISEELIKISDNEMNVADCLKKHYNLDRIPTCNGYKYLQADFPEAYKIANYLSKVTIGGTLLNVNIPVPENLKRNILPGMGVSPEGTGKMLLADNIYDLIEDLMLFSKDITLDNIKQIFNGAYVIMSGDKGSFYRKQYENKNYYTISYHRNDLKLPKAGKWKMTSMGSSHHSEQPKQLRIGVGSLVNTDNTEYNDLFDLIMGTYPIEGPNYGDTWFQFEKGRAMPYKYQNLTYSGDATSKVHFIPSIYYFGTTGVNKLLRPFSKDDEDLHTKMNYGPFGWSIYTEDNPLVLNICGFEPNGELQSCIRN